MSPYEEHLKSRSSPRLEGKRNEKKRKSGAAAALKEEDKLSTKSESDSEPDRRRSTRGTTRSQNNAEKTPEVTERKRRSNVSTPPIDSSSSEADKESVKNIKIEADIKLAEAEEVDIINSPQSSITSDGTTENNASIGEADDTDLADVKKFGKYKIGSKISVRYGNGKNQRTYTAKILEVDKDDLGAVVYYIHYNGWNHRYNLYFITIILYYFLRTDRQTDK